MTIYHGSGNGVPCDAEDARNLTRALPFTLFEAWIGDMNQGFHEALAGADVEHQSDLRPCGIHWAPDTTVDLVNWWPIMAAAFGDPAPRSFRYRGASASFAVWDWSFDADPGRAAEFLDILEASATGITLRGSGVTRVQTAPYFVPGAEIALTGARQESVVADELGRVWFEVDLGPPHRAQQFSPTARLAEAAGDYWSTRTVAFQTR